MSMAADEGRKLQPAGGLRHTTGFLAAFGALVALQRRALYGGSYMVRVSLSQTGVWVAARLGIAGPERVDAAVALEGDENSRLCGQERHRLRRHELLAARRTNVRDPAALERPTRPLGSDPAVWPKNLEEP